MVDQFVNQMIDKGAELLKKEIEKRALEGKEMINKKLFRKENSLGKVVVCGLAGQGKSNLINKILNKKVAESKGAEGGSQGVTKSITEYKSVLTNGLKIKLYDTPGIGDMDVKLGELKNQFESMFSNKTITAFLYVKRLDENRIYQDEYPAIQICESCISDEINALKHVIVVFTYYDKLDEKSKAEDIATSMLKEYNKNVKQGNFIDKYVILDINNPSKSIEKIINYLKQFEIKLHISNQFLIGYATEILKQYGVDVNCFNYNTLINKKDIFGNTIQVRIDQIQIGDLVETLPGRFESVLTVNNHINCLFPVLSIHIRIDDTNEVILEVTGNHMLYIKRKEQVLFIPAHKVEIFDEIEINRREKHFGRIVQIRQIISTKVVNIRTPSRMLITNNVIVSCDVVEDLGEFGGFVLSKAAKINKYLPQKISEMVNKVYNGMRKIKNKLKF
jgi:ribosome biogenesis GTPase A